RSRPAGLAVGAHPPPLPRRCVDIVRGDGRPRPPAPVSNVTPPVALTIAGSDSGGAAGIQADLKAFAALGVFGTTAVTAVTAQNTLGVEDVHVVPAEYVDAQISAVVTDLRPSAVKTGMLASA